MYAIKNMLMSQLTAYLAQEMDDVILDETSASVVREGKLQANPGNDTGVNILILSEDDEDPDELWTKENAEGLQAPTYEIGGNGTYYLRFKLKFTMHFRGLRGDEGRTEARERAYVIAARAKKSVFEMPLPKHPDTGQTKDDFGETVIDVQVDSMHITTGGGSGYWIWKGYMNFGYLVSNEIEKFTGELDS